MGWGAGWGSFVQSVAQTLAQLVGQDVVAKSFTSTQVSGSGGFVLSTDGARVVLDSTAGTYIAGLSAGYAMRVIASGGRILLPAFADIPDAVGMSWDFYTASGRTAILFQVAGARLKLGPGTTDYLTSNGTTRVQAAGELSVASTFVLSSYTDDSATPGNRTVNNVRGKNAFAIGAATCTITNSFVTANSQVLVSLEFADATLNTIRTVIPAAGSFVVTGNANATAATKFSWTVIN